MVFFKFIDVTPWDMIVHLVFCTGVWFMHCHFEFHMMMGMAAVFIVEDGPTVDSVLPPPPLNYPKCGHVNSLKSNELYLMDNKVVSPA